MSLCELSASHDTGVGATDTRVTTRKLNNTPSNEGNQQRASSDLSSHPGMRFIDANSNKPTSNGSNQQAPQAQLPFSPRPAVLQQVPAAQSAAFPHSKFNNPKAQAPVRTNDRSARMPVPTQPLTTAAVGDTTPKPPPEAQSASAAPETTSLHQLPPKPAKKRPRSAVLEITKIVMPKDFLPKEVESREDVYAKLPTLWAKTGNPDEIYVNWTNPGAPSAWEATTMLQREAPVVPPPGTPTSSSSESEVEIGSDQRSTLVSNTRSRGATVAEQIYVDSRYIGVTSKKAKLMHQSFQTKIRMGPLDSAQFRDYQLLPIDYYVAPMEGFQAAAPTSPDVKDNDESKRGDEAQEGRPRRSRRQPQPSQAPTTPNPPPKDKKKRRKVTKTSVFVGKNHQVDCLPPAMGAAYKVDPTIYQDSSYASDNVRDDQIWDPKRADAAERRGEDIAGFLLPARELNSQALLIQALHQADYCVSRAEMKFVDLYRASIEPSTEMSDQEKIKADALFETSSKDFVRIAKELNRSVAAVLAQYYYWKAMEKRSGNGAYARLKNMWKNEEDHCYICDDGGILIVCDHCHKAYHLECLTPPLKEAPENDWYCSQCLKSPAKLRRLPSLTLGTQTDERKPSAMKALPFSQPAERQNLAPLLPLVAQAAAPLLPSVAQAAAAAAAAHVPTAVRQMEAPGTSETQAPTPVRGRDAPGTNETQDNIIDLTDD